MDYQLTLHLKNFNNKVKVMNQTNSKELVLTKLEAQNLLSDIVDLLAHCTELTKVQETENSVNVKMDGGNF